MKLITTKHKISGIGLDGSILPYTAHNVNTRDLTKLITFTFSFLFGRQFINEIVSY